MRQFVFVLSALCPLFLLMSGCSRKDGEDDASQNVWRRPLFTKIQTLDSGNLSDVYSLGVASNIYETLYDYHYLKRPVELIPLLAEGLPQISEDKLTYTIKIKSGVFFQDDPCFPDGKGRELKAQDFVYALKRIANVKYMSQRWSDFDQKIVGLDDFREYSKQFKKELDIDYSKEVKGFRAIDDYTLQVQLNRPWPKLVSILSLTYTAPVAREAVAYYGSDIISHPVGTGPYKLKTWHRGVYIEMVRNEKWRGGVYPSEGVPGDLEAGYLEDAGQPLATIDRLIYRVIEEFQPAWLLFKRGDLDWMQTFKDNFNEAVNAATLEATPEMTERGIELVLYDDPSVFWIGFNMQDPVLGKNKSLRKAICRAIDRDKFIDLFFHGVHKKAYGYIPPALPEYNPDIVNTDYAKYDPDEARVLVRKAQTEHGGPIPPLKLAIPGTGTWERQAGQFLLKYFQDAGLELKVEYMDWPTYLDVINKGKHQMYFSGGSPSVPDAMDMLMSFYTKYWGYGGNHYFYSNPEFDKLYEKADVLFPGPEKNELCHKMEEIVLGDYPAVFVNHRVSTVLRQSWFKNYKPHVFSYNTAKYWKIDTDKKNEYKDLLKELKKKER
ncbi:MAG: ABC transporter substrate-binding protein [Planctomycetota bacterium]|jgi:ABC-type transport system substrate-binding protein